MRACKVKRVKVCICTLLKSTHCTRLSTSTIRPPKRPYDATTTERLVGGSQVDSDEGSGVCRLDVRRCSSCGLRDCPAERPTWHTEGSLATSLPTADIRGKEKSKGRAMSVGSTVALMALHLPGTINSHILDHMQARTMPRMQQLRTLRGTGTATILVPMAIRTK